MVVVDDESTGRVENLAAILDHFDFEYVLGSAGDDVADAAAAGRGR